jgi:hypothetical protein
MHSIPSGLPDPTHATASKGAVTVRLWTRVAIQPVSLIPDNCSVFCACADTTKRERWCRHRLFVLGRLMGVTQRELDQAAQQGPYALPADVFARSLLHFRACAAQLQVDHTHCPRCLEPFREGESLSQCCACEACLVHPRCTRSHNPAGLPDTCMRCLARLTTRPIEYQAADDADSRLRNAHFAAALCPPPAIVRRNVRKRAWDPGAWPDDAMC